MRFSPFGKKQLKALCWWMPGSPDAARDGIICDGAVRSGKTLCLSLSFIGWAMAAFSGMSFALCGKTITSLERNVLSPLLPVLEPLGFCCRYLPSRRVLTVRFRGRENRFYLFGGRDEGSAALIQGITLAGVLLDEVALMPRSFVEQALARCSVAGSRFWFSCNPEHPFHWFYQEWIEKAAEKNMLYLHFTMEDNPSLTPEVRRRYESLYSGAFYDRFVLGRWVAPSGVVYPMFTPAEHIVEAPPGSLTEWYCSCDYGTVNPCSIGLWGYSPADGKWYRAAEYYHDSRKAGVQKTDEEYCNALLDLIGKTGIFDHDPRGEKQTARIYKAWVEPDEGRLNFLGEPYLALKASAYMVRTAANADLILEIDAGIKKEVSVGCAIAKSTCSVCGADRHEAPCAHLPGKRYGKALCFTLLEKPTDAYEWSFVAVPSQPAAGVTKAHGGASKAMSLTPERALQEMERGELHLDAATARALRARIGELEAQGEAALRYREGLCTEIRRLSLMAQPELSLTLLEKALAPLTVPELEELRMLTRKQMDRRFPPLVQTAPTPQETADGTYEHYKI